MGSSFYGGNKNSFYGGSGFYGGGGEVEPELTVIDKVPYNFRKTGGDIDVKKKAIKETVVGGTIAWNQLIQNGNFVDTNGWSVPAASTLTVENGKATISGTHSTYTRIQRTSNSTSYANHKYLIILKVSSSSGKVALIPMGGTAGGIFNFTGLTEESQIAMIWAPSEDYTTVTWHVRFNTTTSGVSEDMIATVRDYCVFDLTQMFGSTIADYIYSLEQTNTGNGVAWFRKLFPKDYYAYEAGSLQSVQTSAHKMVGFNAWDEKWELGAINSTTGQNGEGSLTNIRSTNYIPVIPNAVYYFTTSANLALRFYDANKNYLGNYDANNKGDISITGGKNNRLRTMPTNCAYLRFYTWATYGTIYKKDICINLSQDGTHDGEYKSHIEYSYPLDDSLTLYGFPKLDGNNHLYYDGDTYESDGTVTRKFGMVDLGTRTFTYMESAVSGQYVFRFYLPSDATAATGSASTKGIICPIYTTFYNANTDGTGYASHNMSIYRGKTRTIYIRNDDYTDAATFKTAMSGIYVIYELETPTPETADAYTNPQIVDILGTEQYVDASVEAGTRNVAIPVGHETIYKI